MRIDLKDGQGQTTLRIEVDPARPPTLVRWGGEGDTDAHTQSLDWDRALDEHGALRRCPVCGCEHLFRRRPVPRVTLFVVVAAAGVLAVSLTRPDLWVWTTAVAAAILLLDVVVIWKTRPMLTCYRCVSEFRHTPVHKRHKPWDPRTAERVAAEGTAPTWR